MIDDNFHFTHFSCIDKINLLAKVFPKNFVTEQKKNSIKSHIDCKCHVRQKQNKKEIECLIRAQSFHLKQSCSIKSTFLFQCFPHVKFI